MKVHRCQHVFVDSQYRYSFIDSNIIVTISRIVG
jgi:hypothetical protein